MAQTLGERLKAVRRRLGMSQEELATRAGVAQEAIARVEQNKRQYMRSDELGRIAEALDAPADELLGISASQTEVAIGEVAATHVFGFDAGVCLPTSILQGSRDRLLSGQMMAETMLTDHESKESNQDYDAEPPEQYARFKQQIAAADGILFVSPEYNRGIPGVLKNAIDVGSRPYGQSVFDKKPAAIVTASPGSIGGFGANHQIRQACVFLNMPVMQQPEAYLGHVTDDSFDESGCLKEGALKTLITSLAHAFHDWVDMIHRSRRLLAEDSAHAAQAPKEHA